VLVGGGGGGGGGGGANTMVVTPINCGLTMLIDRKVATMEGSA